MQSINERIDYLIQDLGITKTAFAEKLNVTQQYVSKLVKTGEPSKMLKEDICEKFGVRRDWLENGLGEIYTQYPEDAELDQYIVEIADDAFIAEFVKKYMRLSPGEKEIIKKMFVFESNKKAD